MQTKPIILVTGATGAQGGSVARALLKSKKYTVRILTRNANSHQAKLLQLAGAQVAQGDLDDVKSLIIAMKDCYGVYGVTNFWEHFAKEYQQGKNLVNAVHHAGIKHFVLHTLPDYYKLSNGRYSVPHCDIKAALEQYTRSLKIPATFVHLAFYYENFLSFFPLQKNTAGGFSFGFPQGNTRLAMTSVDDTGPIVARIFDQPESYTGKVVGVVGADDTCDEYAKILSGILGKDITYNYISRNEYAAYNFPGAEELANMFEVQRLYIPNRHDDMEQCYQMNPSMQTFTQWVISHKQDFLNMMNEQMDVFVI